MLHRTNTLAGYTLSAIDGDIGSVRHFYFDDRTWAIRYLIAETGPWLLGRQVLLSPYALVSADPESKKIEVILTKKQIEESPSLETDRPVSRQFEEDYYEYYGWPAYWHSTNLVGPYAQLTAEMVGTAPVIPEKHIWDTNLRSTGEVNGYFIEAKDGPLGHIVDFIVDSQDWSIRYAIVDAGPWWGGKMILIAPSWIESISFLNKKATVEFTKDQMRLAPEFSVLSQVTREYETSLHRHYDVQGYWVDEPIKLPVG